jgi:hypothetical protein
MKLLLVEDNLNLNSTIKNFLELTPKYGYKLENDSCN